ncbi:hypothetical protein Ahy_B01g055886 [Arachis hypogaea]|uniref:Uncharacterized protein n=2 Tax=Arachis TaxID=3817 RepID=A0A445AXF7_ARAHY|nr:hypothetical protein Ahy_B01g055886 [Arachis hypogaea]
MPYSAGPYQQMQQGPCLNLHQSPMSGNNTDREGDIGDPLQKQFEFPMNRSDDEDEYGVYQLDSEMRHYPQVNIYYGQAEFEGISNTDGSQKVHPDADNGNANLTSENGFDTQGLERNTAVGKSEDEPYIYENEAPSSLYVSEDVDAEPVDFENNGLLWLPPVPEDAEDERETFFVDEDDEDNGGNGNAIGEWGYLRNSNSFGSGEHRHKDRTSEEQKKVMKNAVDGHFRALVAQLLQVENLPIEDNGENVWMEIITSLSWEAATLLKPDTSKSGGMVVKGVVCKKNVAHRRMTSKGLLSTGTQNVPSIDHLSSPKLGYCEAFHVEKFVENLSSAAAQGADEEELKEVKHVVQYAVFAAYHLALETSFLADEGISSHKFRLTRSISTFPDFVAASSEKSQGLESDTGPWRTKSVSSTESYLSNDDPCESLQSASCISHATAFYSSIVASGNAIPGSYNEKILPSKYTNDSTQPLEEETPEVNNSLGIMNDPTVNGYGPAEKLDHGINRFCNIHFITFGRSWWDEIVPTVVMPTVMTGAEPHNQEGAKNCNGSSNCIGGMNWRVEDKNGRDNY